MLSRRNEIRRRAPLVVVVACALAALVLGFAGPAQASPHGRAGVYVGYGHHYPHYGYPRLSPYGYWGWGGGYWGWGPGYWGWGGGYWGWDYPVAVRNPQMGALDLAIKPKKVEVYIDGQYVGMAGDFDGFPSYLWLKRGPYTLAFYKDGYRTEERQVSFQPGAVGKLRLTLVPGESVRPQIVERAAVAAPEQQPRTGARRTPPASRPPRAEAEGSLDVRAAPGQVHLKVLPADASVYLDGRFVGTGEEISRLHAGLLVDAGDHLLEVVRPGFAARQVSLAIEPGQQLDVEVSLESEG